MKRFFSFFVFFLVYSFFVHLVPLHAASFSWGDLVRSAAQADVYYYGTDNHRYVFPNSKTYSSWYSDFSLVKIITAQELAAIPLKGAVTYRPGVRLVKLTTDPKVYAVAKGGVLRWVTTEAIASALYGKNWMTFVDDLPDAFFATYTFGQPILSESDYQPVQAIGGSSTISSDKGILPPAVPIEPPVLIQPTSTAVVPSSTIDVMLSVSKSPVRPGDIETVMASASSLQGISSLKLFLDDLLIQSCNSSICSGETVIPVSGTKSVYTVKAVASTITGESGVKTFMLLTSTSTDGLVNVSVTRSVITPAQVVEVIVNADASISVQRTDIYVNGISVKACAATVKKCKWTDYISGVVGDTYDVYGSVTDNLGRLYESVHQKIAIGNHDSPIISASLPKNNVALNEKIDVLITASDDEGVATINVLQDGVVVKTCTGALSCMFNAGPWSHAGSVIFSGQAIDAFGVSASSSPAILTIE